jgi:multisubunit Na+/H+ antiporter MnhG subunit
MNAVVSGLVAAGVLVLAWACVSAACTRSPYQRLHFLAPMTSLGTPLVGAALVLDSGWQLSTGWIVVVVLLLFLTGPVVQAAIGKEIAREQGRLASRKP